MAEVIVALDVPVAREALELVERLPGLRWVKVGSVLFVRSGLELVQELKRRDLRVFLDLKWHDIPNTVAEAVRVASEEGVDLATVHALGGGDMIEAACAVRGEMRLAAVTVLTSLDADGYWRVVGRESGGPLGEEVVRLARLAFGAGVDAIVTSPWEVAEVRSAVGRDPWLVVPGIRLPGVAVEDQRRVAGPRVAVEAGATHLVVGRAIIRAERPAEVYDQLCEEVA